MPILQGAVTFARFEAQPPKKRPKDPRRSLARDVRARAFEPLDKLGEQERTAGWVELLDHDGVELPPGRFLFGPRLLVTYRIDARKVPAQMVRRTLDEWAKDYATRHGRTPHRTDRATQKELILKRLRKQAFVTTKTHDVAWNLDTNEVLIWCSSRKIIDEIQIAVEETFEVPLSPRSPGALADASGATPAQLTPTAALFGLEIEVEGRTDG